ncbi:Vsp protein (plasmid) [Borrelia crocidurae str. Achema]|uniref:Vsp protein n=1 Tax=Borrelia crocidurae (strain Achema) TaxID=1155096 RepID=I0FF99_BORCA|nr:Vsp protein [Borrelia crocidurae str. Achema]
MIGEKIKSAVEFAGKVKEVHVLVRSVDELAKAIGKKIDANGSLADEAGQNGSLIAGVHSVISAVNTKLKGLETTDNISDELKGKIVAVETEGKAFLDKLKNGNAELGKKDASDDDTKKAIDRIGKKDGDKGVAELIKLNTAIDALLKLSTDAIEALIGELTVNPAV